MLGAGLMDEVDMNNCGDVFDHIDDLMNFPSEDTDGFAAFGGECDGLKDVWPAPQDAFKKSGLLSGGSGTSELPSELYVPYDDIVQLEWLSNFVEDSFSTKSILADKDSSENGSSNQQSGATKNSSQIHNPSEDSLSAKRFIVDNDSSSDNNSSNNHSDAINNSDQFNSTSPVSVLESSSSTSEKTMVLSPETAVPGRARSKRPRPVNFSARSVIPLISPTSSITSPSASITSLEIPSEFENFAESQLQSKTPKLAPSEPKKKKKKVSPLPVSMESSASPRPIAVRKCLHCEITKTPQWRAGPMGPKTLCNACGVRYKSGRLFPEYRPAASPTFVPTIHSNSHKKVLEMRCKDGQNLAAAEAAAAPELIPNRSHFLDYM